MAFVYSVQCNNFARRAKFIAHPLMVAVWGRRVLCCQKHLKAMIAQSKISAFFVPSSKRTLSGIENEQVPKKLKTSVEVESPKKHELQEEPLQLTPEQRSRMEENKKAALSRLQDKENSALNSTLLATMGPSWRSALSAELSKNYFRELTKFVEMERKKGSVYPPANQVFAWTTMCKISEVKVVILGQDPYHGPRQAHGLCFSVPKGVSPPPSLENMFKELQNDIEGFRHPGHGTLTGWAKQGVLLLNACLTVRAHQANSHQGKGWEQFTDAAIAWLNKNSSGIVFMLWGSYAQKKGACIDKKKHHVLKAVHPSPLSANRGGFFGCKHFSQCNMLLEKHGKTPINWSMLPQE